MCNWCLCRSLRSENYHRGNLMGKRVDHTARSVISSGAHIDLNDVDIPAVLYNKLSPENKRKIDDEFPVLVKKIKMDHATDPLCEIGLKRKMEEEIDTILDAKKIKTDDSDCIESMNTDSVDFFKPRYNYYDNPYTVPGYRVADNPFNFSMQGDLVHHEH
jgi:hypothetical protein